MKRILIVNPWEGNIGPNTFLKNFFREIPENINLTVTIIYPQSDNLSNEIESLGYKIVFNKFIKLNHINNFFYKIIRRICGEIILCFIYINLSLKNKYDIVLVNTEMYSFSLFFISITSSVFVVVHSLSFESASRYSKMFFCIQKMFVFKYLAVSKEVKKALKKVNITDRVEVTYNGVSLPGIWQKESSKFIRIISVIHPVPHKGAHLLIPVFEYLKNHNVKFEWTILGWFNKSADKNYENSILEKIEKLNLGDQIKILGNIDNIHDWYKKSDLLVHPSLSESFGFVIAEAMSYSIPVVAFNVGALKEIVINEETGFLIPSFNSIEMAKKIEVLIYDRDLRYTLGRSSHRIVENKFLLKNTMIIVYKVLGII